MHMPNAKKPAMSKPFPRFGTDAPATAKHIRVTYRDPMHTAFNKRPGQNDGRLDVTFDRHTEAGWLHIVAEESMPTKNGGSQTRTVSFVLDREMAEALAAFIQMPGLAPPEPKPLGPPMDGQEV